MRCHISSACSSKGDLSAVVSELSGLGFRRIELTGNIEYSMGLAEKVLYCREKFGIDFIIHNYLPMQPDTIVMNLASSCPAVHEQTLQLVAAVISLSRRLGNDMYSMHPGFKHELSPEKEQGGLFTKTREDCNRREDFYLRLRHIAQSVVVSDFKLAVENLTPKNTKELYSFLCTLDDIDDFFGYFKDMPNVGLLLDMGHFNVTAACLGFDRIDGLDRLFGKYRDKIYEIHLSDNDGTRDAHSLTAKDSWQVEYLLDHRKHMGNTPVVMEWHHCAVEEAYARYCAIQERLEP